MCWHKRLKINELNKQLTKFFKKTNWLKKMIKTENWWTKSNETIELQNPKLIWKQTSNKTLNKRENKNKRFHEQNET